MASVSPGEPSPPAEVTEPCTAVSLSPKKRTCSSTWVESPEAVTAMTLQAANYSNKILDGLNELRAAGQLCDYTLAADDKALQVHRAVMVACSDYFRAMLIGQMRESTDNKVELKGVTGEGLTAVVTFAYTGSLRLSLENLEEVLAAATHLQMAEAVELCCVFMEMALTVDNCVDILNLSELYSLSRSLNKARTFILHHFEMFCGTEQYARLTASQLASMLQENCLVVQSEYKLFQLVLNWINHDRPAREPHVATLMRQLRLPLLSGEELVDKASRVEVMRHNRECNDLLTEAKDYHIVVSKQPLLQTSRTQVRSDIPSLVMCHAENLESYDFENKRHAFLKDAPVPLYSPCVCIVDNFMYACGGKYDSNENNEIATARCFRYDPRFDSWFELASMNESRKDFVMVAHNNCLYAIAGQDENLVMCTVECFSIANNDWECKGSLNHAVYGHAGGYCGERIYICGGQKFDGHCNKVLSYLPEKDQWNEEPSLHSSRSNHMALELHGFIYVLGGNTEDSYGFPVPITSIERFDPSKRQWTVCEAVLNIREAGCCLKQGSIYIVGGINGQHYFSDLIQKYDAEKDKVDIVDRFPNRIYGRACCVLTLPKYI